MIYTLHLWYKGTTCLTQNFKIMKTISIFKRWASMSLLFLGISLMVYADAPRVVLSNVIVSNVTSNSVDLEFAYLGATRLTIGCSTEPGGWYITYIDEVIPSDSSNAYVVRRIRSLLPNTTYHFEVKVTSAPDPDDPNNSALYNREYRYVTVTTDAAPEL